MDAAMFYGGLILAAAGLAAMLISAILYRAKKQALDAQLNREYGEKAN